jgi:hypothetical protein
LTSTFRVDRIAHDGSCLKRVCWQYQVSFLGKTD